MAEIKKIQIWPLGIGIFYGAFVLVLLVFLVFSILYKDDLESNDYYTKELIHQKQIERMRHSQKLGYILNWYFDKKNDTLVIEFPKNLEFSEINGKITFFRPSDANLDKVFPIAVNPFGKQYIQTHDFDKGNWRIKILWRNTDGEFFQEGQIILP